MAVSVGRHATDDTLACSEMLKVSVGEVLREAAEARALRARVAELERELHEQSACFEVVNRGLHATVADLTTTLKKEQKMRKAAEASLTGKTLIDQTSPSTFRVAMALSCQFLKAADLMRMGSGCVCLHGAAQQSNLWHAICLRHFPAAALTHCTNFRAKMVGYQAQQKLGALDVANGGLRLSRDLFARYRAHIVSWTIRRRLLNDTPQGSSIESPWFVVRGVDGFFSFYPKGLGLVSSCSFYVSLLPSRGMQLSAVVWIGHGSGQTLSHYWAKKSPLGQQYGLQYAGQSFGKHASSLTITVEFGATYKRGDAAAVCNIES